jgi:hypothetical protein
MGLRARLNAIEKIQEVTFLFSLCAKFEKCQESVEFDQPLTEGYDFRLVRGVASKHSPAVPYSHNSTSQLSPISFLQCVLGPLERANLNHWVQGSKGPNRVGVSLPSSEDRDRSSFRNVF